jgi:hypothetical protein
MNIEKLHIASKKFKQSLENVKYIKDYVLIINLYHGIICL